MTLYHGDCLDVMPTFDAESIDAIVTDPPYDLTTKTRNGSASTFVDNPYGRARIGTKEYSARGGFMGKTWDATGVAFDPETWRAALRVAKPGAHLLAFGGTRTYHRLACAIEDAGWEIRDCLVWAYAQGFPKSLNLPGGLGTALKPAWEPIILARKPLRGTVAANVERYGTGALNIDDCRIGFASPDDEAEAKGKNQHTGYANPGSNRDSYSGSMPPRTDYTPPGRWPANVVLTDPIFDGDVPGVVGGGMASPGTAAGLKGSSGFVDGYDGEYTVPYGDSGTYSRFFLVPKASRGDREPVLGDGPARVVSVWGGDEDDLTAGKKSTIARRNHHPTVKPLDLMRHLVRLVTPPGGLVLDPFLGSGTTALAAEMEGLGWVGIEREASYVEIAEARLNGTQRGLGLGA